MKIAYEHIVNHIKESPTIGELSDKLFQLGHEHEIEGNIFDMEFTPNRGDCLSLNGLLRDLAVFYTIDNYQKIFTEKINDLSIDFENKSENICSRISFLKLEVANNPIDYKPFLNSYFSNLHLNKNNFFTDVSNYLSYETGQPTHCYDANKMKGKLIFHEINEHKEFETLLNKKLLLSNKNAVFSLDGKVINLAGIVGGKSTSCSSDTKSVIIECAYFHPESIIGKSVKYDIQSESAHKFERGTDPDCHEKVLRRFIEIVRQHVKIKQMSLVSFNYKENFMHEIPFDLNKINRVIGSNINEEECLGYLSKLGFFFEKSVVKVPSYRNDIKTQNDLAEEVARVIGYNNIKRSEIKIPSNKSSDNNTVENKLRYFLLDHGFYEVINSPFTNSISKEAIKVDNPLDSNREYLRTNLINSLVDNLLFNEKRQKDSIKLFEISDVYSSNRGIQKERRLCIIASGKVGHNYEEFSKKINIKYLSKIFQKILPNDVLNFKLLSRDSLDTKIKNDIISLEVNIDELSMDALEYKQSSKPPKGFIQYKPISEQPSSIKDISYSLKDYGKTQELQKLLLNYECDIIKEVYVFDYFFNEKMKEIKMGFRFIFQSNESTLTAAQIDFIYNEIIEESLKINGITIPGL